MERARMERLPCVAMDAVRGSVAGSGMGPVVGPGVARYAEGALAVVHAAWLETVGERAESFGLVTGAEEAGGVVDLLYVDPPFGTGVAQVGRAGRYEDGLTDGGAYEAWIEEHLRATARVLKADASVLVHVDWRVSHRVRVAMDRVFGAAGFVNHLVWRYGLGGSSPTRFARKHDDIFLYRVDPDRFWFEAPMVPATSARMRGQMKKATDVLDVPALNNMAHERVGWPTQKPSALLELLIGACCRPGGLVLDPCAGSGTTGAAALALGRRCVLGDASEEAFGVMRARFGR